MNFTQANEEHDYSNGTADRFEGFDRGDSGDDEFGGAVLVGSMHAEWEGGLVQIHECRGFYTVTVHTADEEPAVFQRATRDEANALGRWWLAGCPA